MLESLFGSDWAVSASRDAAHDIYPSCYDVVWDSPSEDSSGSMPLGNGDIGLNVWSEPNGDVLFYIGKSDSFDGCLRLLKLGRVRLRVRRDGERPDGEFRQRLNLEDGSISVDLGEVSVRLWADANHPVVRVEVASPEDITVEASLEVWRTERRTLEKFEWNSAYGLNGGPVEMVSEPDVVCETGEGDICWYHRNKATCHEALVAQQSLQECAAVRDLLKGRTFGGLLRGEGFVRSGEREDGQTDENQLEADATPAKTVSRGIGFQPMNLPTRRADIKSRRAAKSHVLEVHILTAQTDTAKSWKEMLDHQVAEVLSQPLDNAWQEHCDWWRSFWERSYVVIDGSEEALVVGRGYTLQRFIAACAGRGALPIKFNGSLFTVDGRDEQVLGDAVADPDYRLWGGHYWHQNTRLPYWGMLASGDFEMMEPFFRFYRERLEISEFRAKSYFGHGGALIPETITLLGTYAGSDYGWDREGLAPGESPNQNIRRHFCGGLETAAMMLDFHAYTCDSDFARLTLVPFAAAAIRFYSEHFKKDGEGQIRIEPSQALETWQDTVNPVPDVAALHYCLERLLGLPADLVNDSLREEWQALHHALPDLPVTTLAERRAHFASRNYHELENSGVSPDARVLMPAQEIRGGRSNWENPELYAVFPYRCFQVGKPDLEVGINSYLTRHDLVPLPVWYRERYRTIFSGWNQDDIHAAILGLGEEAGRGVAERFSTSHLGSRFPAFWGPNYDWVPDQDHGSVGIIAVQNMLLQEVDGKLHILPAWPPEWNVRFRLHALGRTLVECTYRNGRIDFLHIDPPERRADVEIAAGVKP